jgi:hypothetical protein
MTIITVSLADVAFFHPDADSFGPEEALAQARRLAVRRGLDVSRPYTIRIFETGVLEFVQDLPSASHSTPPPGNNAAAIALLNDWYATPEVRPLGYWDGLLHDRE